MAGRIREWNPQEGEACQGDIILFRLPEGLAPDVSQPVGPMDQKLILAEGEITGHHHAIWFNPPMFRDDGLARELATEFQPAQRQGSATLYHDDLLIERLLAAGELTSRNLAIGFLAVADAPVLLLHEEHDPIRIPPGNYYVGRQREFRDNDWQTVED